MSQSRAIGPPADDPVRHRIGTCTTVFDVTAERGPMSSPERVLQALRVEVLPALEELLHDSRMAGASAQVEHLEIDLGHWPENPDWAALRAVFRDRLESALSPYLEWRHDTPGDLYPRLVDQEVATARQSADLPIGSSRTERDAVSNTPDGVLPSRDSAQQDANNPEKADKPAGGASDLSTTQVPGSRPDRDLPFVPEIPASTTPTEAGLPLLRSTDPTERPEFGVSATPRTESGGVVSDPTILHREVAAWTVRLLAPEATVEELRRAWQTQHTLMDAALDRLSPEQLAHLIERLGPAESSTFAQVTRDLRRDVRNPSAALSSLVRNLLGDHLLDIAKARQVGNRPVQSHHGTDPSRVRHRSDGISAPTAHLQEQDGISPEVTAETYEHQLAALADHPQHVVAAFGPELGDHILSILRRALATLREGEQSGKTPGGGRNAIVDSSVDQGNAPAMPTVEVTAPVQGKGDGHGADNLIFAPERVPDRFADARIAEPQTGLRPGERVPSQHENTDKFRGQVPESVQLARQQVDSSKGSSVPRESLGTRSAPGRPVDTHVTNTGLPAVSKTSQLEPGSLPLSVSDQTARAHRSASGTSIERSLPDSETSSKDDQDQNSPTRPPSGPRRSGSVPADGNEPAAPSVPEMRSALQGEDKYQGAGTAAPREGHEDPDRATPPTLQGDEPGHHDSLSFPPLGDEAALDRLRPSLEAVFAESASRPEFGFLTDWRAALDLMWRALPGWHPLPPAHPMSGDTALNANVRQQNRLSDASSHVTRDTLNEEVPNRQQPSEMEIRELRRSELLATRNYWRAVVTLSAERLGPDRELSHFLERVLTEAFPNDRQRARALRYLIARLKVSDGSASPALRIQTHDALSHVEQRRSVEHPQSKPDGARTISDWTRQTQPSVAERLLSTRSGLVLFHPFLKLLFQRLDVLDGPTAIRADRVLHARRALQILSDGPTSGDRPTDPVEKLLLGLPLNWVHPGTVLKDPPDAGLVDGLVQAVIDQWGGLGQTSPETLREVFVNRAGTVLQDENGHRLTVDPGPYDMLLDKLPWGISTVALPWMDQPCHVAWRSGHA